MNPGMWSDAFLDDQRAVGDPAADAAVATIDFDACPDPAGTMLDRFLRLDPKKLLDPRGAGLPEAVARLVESSRSLPSWIEPDKIDRGRRMFLRHGPASVTALLCASLPECYSHSHGAQVLWYTQKLHTQAARRVQRTAIMIMEVMRTGGLADNGAGVLASMKTRLVHAVMRRLILSRPPEGMPRASAVPASLGAEMHHSLWNPAWGTPINQEDSGFTLLTFSFVVARSLRRLGLRVSNDEREAFLHCWNVVGHFLGVNPELYVWTWDDAELGFKRFQERQQKKSVQGRDLTRSLSSVLDRVMQNPRWSERVGNSLIRTLTSSGTSAAIGMPRPSLTERLTSLGLAGFQLANVAASSLSATIDHVLFLLFRRPIPKPDHEAAARIGKLIVQVIVAILGRKKDEPEIDPGAAESSALETARELLGEIEDELDASGSPIAADDATDLGKLFVRSLGTTRKKAPPETGPDGAVDEAPAPRGGPPAYEIPDEMVDAWDL